MTPPPSPSEPDREAAIHAAISELIAQIEPAFEAVDHPRNGENNQYHRVVVDWFGYVEPFNPAARLVAVDAGCASCTATLPAGIWK